VPSSSLEQRKRNLRRRKSTPNKREFSDMRRWFPDRVTIGAVIDDLQARMQLGNFHGPSEILYDQTVPNRLLD